MNDRLPSQDKHVVIVGAGPAGLTAAYQLNKQAIKSTVIEKDATVGGLSRTVHHNGYHFDIGGHRFYTKVGVVRELWEQVLGPEFLRRSRLSRIFYRGKLFQYPLKPFDALHKLGLIESIRVLGSYLKVKCLPTSRDDTFETFVTNRFGQRLFRIFFKSYTEKVWGIPCDQISAQWALQRIKGLSVKTALRDTLWKSSDDEVIKSLIETFHYPKFGPGMMWERIASQSQPNARIDFNAEVSAVVHDGKRVEALCYRQAGQTHRVAGTDFLSSMPIGALIEKLDPQAPEAVLKVARRLRHRDFITVALVVDDPALFPDNWIYVHDESVKVGRIQNFKNWSEHMVPNTSHTCVGLEYFCFRGDELWSRSDEALVALAGHELEQLGLASAAKIVEGVVVRATHAYPIYDKDYDRSIRSLRDYLEGFDNLQVIGRNGMHKYNNQDHSMLTAMAAVRNILGERLDVWAVNTETSYIEEIRKRDVRPTPTPVIET